MEVRKVIVIPKKETISYDIDTGTIKKKRVCAYARVSTDLEDQKNSFNAQLEEYQSRILKNPEWEFVKLYSDEGISGTSIKKRKGFQEMIEDALAGKIDLILTKSISRFARNTIDCLSIVRELRDKGVEVLEVMLHVGLGTFRPVKEDDILNHEMHSEYFEVTEEVAQKINDAKKQGKRVIACGTTSVRVLESAAIKKGEIKAQKGDTKIFIYPPYDFKIVDGLITNFHLPESTLLMLVSALESVEEIKQIYNVAVREKYRFFSFGDAMLLL